MTEWFLGPDVAPAVRRAREGFLLYAIDVLVADAEQQHGRRVAGVKLAAEWSTLPGTLAFSLQILLSHRKVNAGTQPVVEVVCVDRHVGLPSRAVDLVIRTGPRRVER